MSPVRRWFSRPRSVIGLARQGYFKPGEKLLFLHTGGLPSLHVYEAVVLGDPAATR